MAKFININYRVVFTYFTFIVLMYVMVLEILPFVIDIERYRYKIVDILEETTGFKYEAEGNIDLDLFPTTKLVVSGVHIKNTEDSASSNFLEISELEITASLISMFKGNLNIKEISILNPVLDYEILEEGISNYSVLIKKNKNALNLKKENTLKDKNNFAVVLDKKIISKKLPEIIKIQGGTLIYRHSKVSKSILENINISSKISPDKEKYTGNFNYNDLNIALHVSADYVSNKISHLKADFKSEIFNINFDSENKTEENKVLEDINLAAKTEENKVLEDIDLESKTKENKAEEDTDSDNNSKENENSDAFNVNFKGKIDKLYKFTDIFLPTTSLLPKITSGESLEVTGAVSVTKKHLSLSEMTINSKSIKGSLTGEMVFSRNSEEDAYMSLESEFSEVNIDSLISEKSEDEKEGYIDYYSYNSSNMKLESFNFTMPKKTSGRIKVKVDKAIYLNNFIKDINLNLEYYTNLINIYPFKLELPGDTKLKFFGSINHNGVRPSLKGKMNIQGSRFRDLLVWLDPHLSVIPDDKMKYFIFTSDVDVNPNRLSSSNIYFSVDRFLATGDFSLRSIKSANVIRLDLKADKMDLDQYNLNKYFRDFSYKFLDNLGKQDLEISKLKVMRNSIILNVELSNILFNHNNIEDIIFSSSMVPGIFNLPYIYINSEKANMNAVLAINLNGNKPKLDFQLYSDFFDTSSIFLKKKDEDDTNSEEDNKKEEDKLSEVKEDKDGSEDTDNPENKEDKEGKEKKEKVFSWSDKPFNDFGLGKFEGNIKLFFRNLKEGNNLFENVQLDSALKKKVLNLKSLGFDYAGGVFLIKGNVSLLSNPVFAMSFVTKNIESYYVAKNLSENLNMKGKLYFQGSLNSSGRSPKQFIKNLNSVLDFKGRNIVIEGFDIDRIIYTLPSLYSAIDMQEVVKESMSSGATEFSVLDGRLNINNMIVKAENIDIRTNRSAGLFAGNGELNNFKMKGIAHMNFMPDPYSKINLILKISGDMLSPDIDIDTKELEDYITDKSLIK